MRKLTGSALRLLAAIFIVLAYVCVPVHAQQEIPHDSLSKLQDILAGVCDRLWEMNDTYWHRGEHDRCIAMMRLITQIDPHDIQAYDSGAWLMSSALRDDEAEAFLLEGVVNNPDSSEMRSDIGHFYYLGERFEESTVQFETAVSLGASDLVWHQLAHAAEHAGYTTDTFYIWLALGSADPDNPVPQIQMDRLMQGDPLSNLPHMITRSREERKKTESKVDSETQLK